MIDGRDVGEGFDRGAGDYDELLRRNLLGAERLVGALPPGRYDRVLDVGCGTGFVSRAMLARFAVRRITGVDPSEGMLERFRRGLDVPGVRVEALRAGVLDMPVPDGAFDAVLSGMAFHWFSDKPAAVAAMAGRLRPGGVLGLLASGRGTDETLRRVLEAIEPAVPPEWIAVFDRIQRDAPELSGYMERAGLEVLDVWEERRVRRAPPEAYLARIQAVAGHLSAGLDPHEARAHGERVALALARAAGPEGFEYPFVKLYGIARRPA